MMKLATQLCILRQVSIKSFLITPIVSLEKEFRIFMRFWETAHLPLPLASFLHTVLPANI